MVRVLGDLSNLSKSFKDAASKGSEAAASLHQGFSGALAVLNRTGVLGPFGEALSGIDEAIETVAKHAKDIGPAMMGIGGALAGVGAGLAVLGSHDQAAHQQLQAAVEATGADYDDYAKRVDAAIKSQEKFGHTAAQTQDALRILTQATGSPAKALQYLSTASDLAAAKHEGLAEAAQQLGKAYNGSARLLKEFGVEAGVKGPAAAKALESATKAAAVADEASAAAKQRLADLEARLNVQHKITQVSTAGVAAAQDRLALAQQHLADVQAVLSTKQKITVSDQIRLRNAQEAVTRAQGGLTTAQEKYRAAVQKAHQPVGLTLAQQQALRNAQQKVAETAEKAKEAHAKLAGAQTTAGKAAHQQGDMMTALSNKLHGQASAAADTFTGKLAAIKAHLEDAAAEFGQKYGPAITAAGSVMAGLGGAITATQGILKAFTSTQKAAEAATEAVKVAEETQAAASWLSLGPILLIIAAIAALVAIGYVIYRNWTTIWNAIKLAVVVVWDWIKANWPLLVGILLGPIGIAAALIYKYWKQIWDGIQAVWHWIVANWPLLLAILTGPIGLAVRWIVQNWGAIVNFFAGILAAIGRVMAGAYHAVTDAFVKAFDWVKGKADAVGGWFAGIPGAIAKAFVGVVEAISGPFRTAFDAISDAWNSTIGAVSFKIPGWVPGLGGKGFSMPHMPHLAQGGLITSTGVVFAHAGEVISPAPQTPRSGPAVVITNAHFTNDVDIETFMRKASWYVQTARI